MICSSDPGLFIGAGGQVVTITAVPTTLLWVSSLTPGLRGLGVPVINSIALL